MRWLALCATSRNLEFASSPFDQATHQTDLAVTTTFNQLIALRGTDGISPAVDIRLPVIHVGNLERQRQVSEMLENLGSWERLRARPSAVREIPKKPGIYMFVWCPPFRLKFADPIKVSNDNQTNAYFITRYVVYVGQAGGGGGQGNLCARFKGEYARALEDASPKELFSREEARSRKDKLKRYLSLEPLEYWFMVVEDTDSLKALERSLQQFLNPPATVQNRPALYTAETRKAFE